MSQRLTRFSHSSILRFGIPIALMNHPQLRRKWQENRGAGERRNLPGRSSRRSPSGSDFSLARARQDWSEMHRLSAPFSFKCMNDPSSKGTCLGPILGKSWRKISGPGSMPRDEGRSRRKASEPCLGLICLHCHVCNSLKAASMLRIFR